MHSSSNLEKSGNFRTRPGTKMSPSGPAGPPPGENRKTPRMASFSPVAYRNSEGGCAMTKSGRIPGFRAGDTPRGGMSPVYPHVNFEKSDHFREFPGTSLFFSGTTGTGPAQRWGAERRVLHPVHEGQKKMETWKVSPGGDGLPKSWGFGGPRQTQPLGSALRGNLPLGRICP